MLLKLWPRLVDEAMPKLRWLWLKKSEPDLGKNKLRNSRDGFSRFLPSSIDKAKTRDQLSAPYKCLTCSVDGP